MNFHLSSLLFFICSTTLFTQTSDGQYYIEIPEKTAFELHNYPVHIDTVVDARGLQDQPLGVGFRGLDARPIDLFMKDGISSAFSKIFDKSIQRRWEDKSILRITFLSINEYVSSYKRQQREVALEAEIAIPTTNGYKLYGPRRIMEHSSALDVTQSHDEAIVEILERMIREIIAFDLNNPAPNIVDSVQVIKPNTQYFIDTVNLTEIPDGVFSTFMDFRAGASKPLFRAKLKKEVLQHTDSSGHIFSVIKLSPDGLLDLTAFNQIWGVQFQGKPYLKIGDFFYEIKRTDEGRLVSAVPEQIFKRTYNTGFVVMSGAMFGAIGSGIAALVSTPGGKSNLGIRAIDPATGRIGFFSAMDKEPAVDDSIPEIAIVSSIQNKRKRPITLTLEDGRNFLLQPGEYVFLSKKMDICLSSVSDIFPECSTLSPLKGQVVFQVKEVGRGNFRIVSLTRQETRLFFEQVRDGETKPAPMIKKVE